MQQLAGKSVLRSTFCRGDKRNFILVYAWYHKRNYAYEYSYDTAKYFACRINVRSTSAKAVHVPGIHQWVRYDMMRYGTI